MLLCLVALAVSTAIGYATVGNRGEPAKEVRIDGLGQAKVPALSYHAPPRTRSEAKPIEPEVGEASTPVAPSYDDNVEADPVDPAVEIKSNTSLPSASPPQAAPAPNPVERGVRGCVNRERQARGLAPLRPVTPLVRAARMHARNMARLGFFDHTDPQGRSVAERVALFDPANRFTVIGENIAAGYDSAASACRGWMSSAGHRQNVLNPDYTHIGTGFARGGPFGRYYVQVFGA